MLHGNLSNVKFLQALIICPQVIHIGRWMWVVSLLARTVVGSAREIIQREMQTQLSVSEAYNQTRVGKTVRVMCEGFDPVAESHYGRSYAEAADIDGKIWFSVNHPNLRIAEGEIIDVKITEAMDYDLVGEALLNFRM